MATTQTVEPEVMPQTNMRGTVGLAELPRRILASNGGAWFAWGFIGGLMFAAAAVYVVRKKL